MRIGYILGRSLGLELEEEKEEKEEDGDGRICVKI